MQLRPLLMRLLSESEKQSEVVLEVERGHGFSSMSPESISSKKQYSGHEFVGVSSFKTPVMNKESMIMRDRSNV